MQYSEVGSVPAEIDPGRNNALPPRIVLYAVGMDLVELETASALLLLLFVVPLAVTMTVFLLWIMYGLTGKREHHPNS